jgi:hypothetical protein
MFMRKRINLLLSTHLVKTLSEVLANDNTTYWASIA